MRLLLVRHGESVWNAEGRWQGQADPPLSDTGRAQAGAAARVLGTVGAVLTSPLQRASETASIIADELGVGPIILIDDLKERDAGEWSGLTRAEIEAAYPGWLDGTADAHRGFAGDADEPRPMRPPGWEHDESVLKRVLSAVERIAAQAGTDDVLAVTHGGLLYTLERHLGAPFERIGNLEGRWVDDERGRLRLGDRVRLVDGDADADAAPVVRDQV